MPLLNPTTAFVAFGLLVVLALLGVLIAFAVRATKRRRKRLAPRPRRPVDDDRTVRISRGVEILVNQAVERHERGLRSAWTSPPEWQHRSNRKRSPRQDPPSEEPTTRYIPRMVRQESDADAT